MLWNPPQVARRLPCFGLKSSQSNGWDADGGHQDESKKPEAIREALDALGDEHSLVRLAGVDWEMPPLLYPQNFKKTQEPQRRSAENCSVSWLIF